MRKILLALMAVVLMVLGCDDSTSSNDDTPQGEYDLTLNMTGMSPHVGQLVQIKVMSSDGTVVADTTLSSLPEADVSVVFTDIGF